MFQYFHPGCSFTGGKKSQFFLWAVIMSQPVILSACRTPIGKFLGELSTLSATELGEKAVAAALSRAGVSPEDVDEVIMGNVLSAGLGQAPARQVALRAGMPPSVAALTINKVCGSGLKAAMLAAQAIALGDARVVVAGGMESMSRAPYLLADARSGWKFGDRQLVDSMVADGLTCPFEDVHMGNHADYIAQTNSISREDQDRYAVESQRRALAAMASGAFDEEIVAIEVPARAGARTVSADEAPRPKTTPEKLASLKPAFQKDGTVTAGNASILSDGAAALVIASPSFASAHGHKPLARIVAYATSGVEPKDIFVAPVPAIRKVLEKAGLSVDDIDLFEVNEAFAAQMLVCIRSLQLPTDKLNVHGGGISLGHPIGASGARVLVTLLHAMERRDAATGLASLCLGGGNAVAMIVERNRDGE